MTGTIYIPDSVSEQLHNAVRSHVADRFGGYTEHTARGGWMDANGDLVEETTHVLTVVGMDETDAQAVARWVAAKSDQEEVLWSHHKTESGSESHSILGEIEAEVKTACATDSTVVDQ